MWIKRIIPVSLPQVSAVRRGLRHKVSKRRARMHASYNTGWYGSQAAEARRLAKAVRSDDLRAIYEDVAEQYEKFAVVTARKLRIATR